MSSVVRAKESKMVTVSSRTPFNLSNKKTSVRIAASSSNSRSISSSNRPSLSNLSPLSSGTHSQVKAHVGAPLTASSSTNTIPTLISTSLSRSSSQRSSERDASIHDSSQSVKSAAVPILNARIIPGRPIRQLTAEAAAARRGRAMRRRAALEEGANAGAGSAVEGSSSGPASVSPAASASAAAAGITPTPARLGIPVEFGEDPGGEGGILSPPSWNGMQSDENGTPRAQPAFGNGIMIPGKRSGSKSKKAASVSPASSLGFVMQDTGSLTISWGD
ncbi:hypothetical protein CPC08DRAFT_303498 [Agrocybe pediades]|nr:hypothetical protein CPC08DRAFT_303498 [Agrocybe pediades]